MVVKRKQHDTKPLEVTLTTNKKAVPLNGCTVVFNMRPKLAGIGTTITRGPCSIIDPAKGLVRYEWDLGDPLAATPIPSETSRAGVHRCEFEVTFSDTSVETFPSDDYLDLEFVGDLG